MAGAAADGTVQAAARGLRYRDFLTVALVIDGEDLFPDNWIYIHEPDVRVGRIQNYRSWSPWMVPDPAKACVGLEYFCFQGDDLWDMADEALVELAKDELAALGLVAREKVERGFVTRVPLAYPMYDAGLRGARRRDPHLARDASATSSRSAATACTATTTPTTRCSRPSARWRTSSTAPGHDLWAVNAESVYHEERPGGRAPLPARARDAVDAAAAQPDALKRSR